MKETVMQGKPYAGNPHVRFDEGAGASRHSGRSALLYKIKLIAMLSMAAVATSLAAMPTKQDLKQVEGLVQELMRPELDAFKAGKKTRADVAKSAIALAEKAESDAAKMLLLKGSFTLYVGHGAFDEAIDVLRTLKTTIPDIQPEYMANMIESALRNMPKSKGGLIYRLLDDTKSYVRHQDELKNALAKSKKRPSDKTLHLKIAELYVCLGDWDKALDEFAKGDNHKAAEAAKAEKGEGKMPKSAIADFWWSYPANGEEEQQKKFKRHAAAIYAEAINSGDASGLVKVKAQRRVDEVKGYGDDMLAGLFESRDDNIKSSHPKPLVFDLGEGVKMEMVGCPRGRGIVWPNTNYTFEITRPFWFGKYPVTVAEWERLMPPAMPPPGIERKDLDPRVPVQHYYSKDPKYGGMTRVEAEEFMSKLTAKFRDQIPPGYVFRLPTDSEWSYAAFRAATPDLQELFECKKEALASGERRSRYFVQWSECKRYWEARGSALACQQNGAHAPHIPVGSKRPNAWGIYDLFGPAFEPYLLTVLPRSMPWFGKHYGQCHSNYARDPLMVDNRKGTLTFGVLGFHEGWRKRWWKDWTRSDFSSGRVIKLRLVVAPDLLKERGITPPTFTNKSVVIPPNTGGAAMKSLESEMVGNSHPSAGNLYCVVDLSAGPNATKYPVSYLAAEPKGGWTDEYKMTKLVLRRIEPGTFIMGEDQKDKSHRVTLTKPFYIGVFEVTQKQYELVMGNNPSHYKGKGGRRPIECVSWEMLRGVHNWPDVKMVAPESFIGRVRLRTGMEGFDLPTEVQWEYSCRAGTTTAFNSGKDLSDENMAEVGRYRFNNADGKGGTGCHTIVGSYKPNVWGLYDMHGNLWEWCLDWRASKSHRVIRGGSWDNHINLCCSNFRGSYNAGSRCPNIGFRLVLSMESTD